VQEGQQINEGRQCLVRPVTVYPPQEVVPGGRPGEVHVCNTLVCGIKHTQVCGYPFG
jgi:hypothetical protein